VLYYLAPHVLYGRAAFYLVSAVYVGVVLTSRKSRVGMRWPAFTSSFVTQAPIEYFSMDTAGDERLETVKGERVFLGLHPHGVYPVAGILTYAGASPLLKRHPWLRVRPCGADILFKIPLIREYLLWTGHLDASRKTLSKHMAKGVDDIGVVIGGEQEALLTANGQEAVVLLGRTGFVSLACQYGYHLVPTYAFGQNEIYTVNKGLFGGARAMLQRRFKMSIPIFWGVRGTPMPHPRKVTLAIGRPIKVPAPSSPGAEPDADLVERLHAEYVAELRRVFEESKAAAGYPERTLQVLEVQHGKKKKKAS